MALQGGNIVGAFQSLAPPPGGEVGGVWEQIELWTLQETPGRVLATGDFLAGSMGTGISLEVGLPSGLISLTTDPNGLLFSGGASTPNTTVSAFLRASIQSLLNRPWNEADSLAMLFEIDQVALPTGSPQVLGFVGDMPTNTTFLEMYQGGWEYTASNTRAFAQWYNTAGAFGANTRTTYVTSGGFDLSGGIITGYTAQGFGTPGASLPVSGSTSLKPGGTTISTILLGSTVSSSPNHVGIWFLRTTTGTVATIRNASLYAWKGSKA